MPRLQAKTHRSKSIAVVCNTQRSAQDNLRGLLRPALRLGLVALRLARRLVSALSRGPATFLLLALVAAAAHGSSLAAALQAHARGLRCAPPCTGPQGLLRRVPGRRGTGGVDSRKGARTTRGRSSRSLDTGRLCSRALATCMPSLTPSAFGSWGSVVCCMFADHSVHTAVLLGCWQDDFQCRNTEPKG